MGRPCPWCLEPLHGRADALECPHCGRPLGEAGELQARDLRFQAVEAAGGDALKRLLTVGLPAVAVVALGAPFLHAGSLALVALITAVHLVATRLMLARNAMRLLRPVRRFLNRWLARFAFLWLGIPGYGSMTIPIVGVVTSCATFVVLSFVIHVSVQATLERERLEKPLATWEKALPLTLAAITLLVLVVVIVAGGLLGWSVLAAIEYIRGME